MSIESLPEINVDTTEPSAAMLEDLTKESNTRLVTLVGSIDSWERIKTFLFASRAMNVAPILLIKKPDSLLEDEEIQYLFGFLRDWDQLYVQNFLAVCGEWVPKEYQELLATEAKIELKWVREWLTANSDPRIYKYPTLPWRSFLRKIVGENFDFALKFLELTAAPATEENVQVMHNHVKQFLETKKKVLCVFPKRWPKQFNGPAGVQEH